MQEKLKLFILAFLLTVIFFIFGYLLGKIGAEVVLYETEQDLLALQNKVESIDVMMASLEFSETKCNPELIEEIGKTISEIGRYVGTLEDEYGIKNRRLLLVKEYYNLILIKYYFLLKKLKKECDFNYTLVLFFYSNDELYYDKSWEYGRYLDYVVYKYWPWVKVFAIESRLIRNNAVKYLLKRYNVTKIPTIIIDDRIKIEEIKGPEDIEKYIRHTS